VVTPTTTIIDNGLGADEQLHDVTIDQVAQRVAGEITILSDVLVVCVCVCVCACCAQYFMAAMKPPYCVNEGMLRYRVCDVTGWSNTWRTHFIPFVLLNKTRK
jgi:hypothetical protein